VQSDAVIDMILAVSGWNLGHQDLGMGNFAMGGAAVMLLVLGSVMQLVDAPGAAHRPLRLSCRRSFKVMKHFLT
jgi:hypothetical protein